MKIIYIACPLASGLKSKFAGAMSPFNSLSVFEHFNLARKPFVAALCAAAALAGPTGHYNNNQHNHSYGYQHGGHYPHAHQTSSSYDPWTGATSSTTSDKAKWFSPYQQYSSPKIKYTGGTSKETEFAQCYATSVATALTTITTDYSPKYQFLFQFAQAPGKTTTMKWFADIIGVTTKSYQVALTEYGRVLNKPTDTTIANVFSNAGVSGNAECANMGNEWRPLGEKDKYGRINPFQDPQRGRIQIVKTQDSGANSTGPTTGNIQANILINLSGPTSIMGRGIKVFEATETATPLD